MEPYTWIVESVRKPAIGLALAASVGLMAALTWFAPPNGGWTAWQFPAFYPHADNDPARWDTSERDKAMFGLGLDFLFLVVYPLLLSLLCSHAAEVWGLPARLAAVCRFAAVGVWTAALFDAAENVGLLVWVLEGRTPNLARAVTVAAGLKWLVIYSALGVFLVAGGTALWLRFARPRANRREERS